jgi:hypothetical protein
VTRLIRRVVDLAGTHTWRALFIAPCALREAHGRGASWRAWGECNGGFDLSRFATYS